MKKSHIRDRIPKELMDSIYQRKTTVRDAAKQLGVTENYLSHAIPERAPRKNLKLLKTTRRLYRDQIVRETIEGRHTVYAGAEIACVSERTMYRYMASMRKRMEKEQNAQS